MKLFAIFAILFVGESCGSASAKKAVTNISQVTIEPQLPTCYVRCNVLVGEPICTVRNGQYHLFENNCARLIHYCNTAQDFEQIDMALCAANICPIPCNIGDNESVCASNEARSQYQSFSSMCDFLNFVCTSGQVWTRQNCP